MHNLTFDSNPQDWSGLEGFRFWFFGTNEAPLPPGSGPRIQLEIKDGGVNAEASELWEVFFTDDFAGWQQVIIPFSDFTRAVDYQPPVGNIVALEQGFGIEHAALIDLDVEIATGSKPDQ